MTKNHRGFTLIELLIVLAIAAILAAVALPAYNSQVRKGKRSEAKTALMNVLQAQEKYRANCSQYASTLGTAEDCSGTSFVLVQPNKSATGLYNVALSGVSGTGFTVTATAASGTDQTKDGACTTLTLQMNQGNVSTTPANCW